MRTEGVSGVKAPCACGAALRGRRAGGENTLLSAYPADPQGGSAEERRLSGRSDTLACERLSQSSVDPVRRRTRELLCGVVLGLL